MTITADRCRETTTTTGTGDVTLAGAASGYQAFSAAFSDGDLVDYCIAGQGTTEWEVGIGKFNSSGTTLTRVTVLSSSNSNAAVSFSAGTKDVFATLSAVQARNPTRGLSNQINGTVLNAPTVATSLAAFSIPSRTLRVNDVLRLTAYVKQVIGTGTLNPRFTLALGGTTPLAELSVGATTDIGYLVEASIQILSASTSQTAWGRITRDTNGGISYWSGTATAADITTALSVNLKGRYNGANGTATLQAIYYSLELIRS